MNQFLGILPNYWPKCAWPISGSTPEPVCVAKIIGWWTLSINLLITIWAISSNISRCTNTVVATHCVVTCRHGVTRPIVLNAFVYIYKQKNEAFRVKVWSSLRKLLRLRGLRCLDFERVCLFYLSCNLQNLRHLRHLRVRTSRLDFFILACVFILDINIVLFSTRRVHKESPS